MAIYYAGAKDAVTAEPLTISRLMVDELEPGVNGPQMTFEMSPSTAGIRAPLMQVEVARYKTFTARLTHLITCSRDFGWEILMQPNAVLARLSR